MKPTISILTAAALLFLLSGCGDPSPASQDPAEHQGHSGEHPDHHPAQGHDEPETEHHEGDGHATH